MFSKPYSRVTHFGVWAEESADHYGRRDAFAVLTDAFERCRDEDMNTEHVFAALDYLAEFTPRASPFNQFRRALQVEHPEERCQAVHSALRAVRRALGAVCM